MDKSSLINTTKDWLLEIACHKENPDVIFIEIDTSVSDIIDEGIVPFLNIYGFTLIAGENFDEAINKTIKEDEYGYIADILNNVVSCDYEIKLRSLYPHWPDNTAPGDLELIDNLRKIINDDEESFKHIKKLYFHHIGDYNFTKIID